MFHGDGYVNGGREFVCYVGFDTPTKDENTKWYACACCPPNVTRLIGPIGKYAYGEKNDTVYCHLFAAGKADFSNRCRKIPFLSTIARRVDLSGYFNKQASFYSGLC